MITIGKAQYLGDRENQEDYSTYLELNGGVFSIVADGMGAFEGGEVASFIVGETFSKFFKKFTPC